jgi:hypothetical protein
VPTGIARSEGHRPHELENDAAPTASQQAAHALIDKAVDAGKVSAADVARITFDGIREGRFYIYSHPQTLAGVSERMEAIVQGQAPADAYAAAPQLMQMLKAALKKRG